MSETTDQLVADPPKVPPPVVAAHKTAEGISAIINGVGGGIGIIIVLVLGEGFNLLSERVQVASIAGLCLWGGGTSIAQIFARSREIVGSRNASAEAAKAEAMAAGGIEKIALANERAAHAETRAKLAEMTSAAKTNYAAYQRSEAERARLASARPRPVSNNKKPAVETKLNDSCPFSCCLCWPCSPAAASRTR